VELLNITQSVEVRGDFVDIGGIVDQVMVNNSTNINKNHLSLQIIE
jgi:hypothetical protein